MTTFNEKMNNTDMSGSISFNDVIDYFSETPETMCNQNEETHSCMSVVPPVYGNFVASPVISNQTFPMSLDGYNRNNIQREEEIPAHLLLNMAQSGVFFGGAEQFKRQTYVGLREGDEGNILIVGSTGSGKTTGLMMPTLQTWKGSICAVDIKGDLSKCSKKLFQTGLTNRKPIVFDPTDPETVCYDPWDAITDSDEASTERIMEEIAETLVPRTPNDTQPFWVETTQRLVAAVLHDSYKRGLSFSQALVRFEGKSTSELIKELKDSGDFSAMGTLGELDKLSVVERANFDTELRNKVHRLASDLRLMNALRGKREGANCVRWNDLDCCNIILRIPQEEVQHWGPIINLMLMQLIHYLQRRPDQFSVESKRNAQVLVMIDEFAEFGRLPMLARAISTLRSKGAIFCFAVQSLAQIDYIYGEMERRIICDNCAYKAILGANDTETQRYLAELTGTRMVEQVSTGVSADRSMTITGCTFHSGLTREFFAQPHEFSTLKDVILQTPSGMYRLRKHKATETLACVSVPKDFAKRRTPCTEIKRNIGTHFLETKDRFESASELLAAARSVKSCEQRTSTGGDEILRLDNESNIIKSMETILSLSKSDPSIARIVQNLMKRLEPETGVITPPLKRCVSGRDRKTR